MAFNAESKMRLGSMSDAINYAKMMLGAPIVNVEMHDEQIKQCVIDAVQLFQRYNMGEGVYEESIVFQLKAGQRSYPMPANIAEIVRYHASYNGDVNQLFTAEHQILMETGILPSIVKQTGGNSTGMDLAGYDIATKYLELYKDFFNKPYTVDFHSMRGELVVDPTPNVDVVGVLIVWKREALANCVNHPDVKKLIVAKCKQLWGTIRGKYSIQLPGGGTIEGDSLKSEGKDEEREIIERMDDESEGNALGFYIG